MPLGGRNVSTPTHCPSKRASTCPPAATETKRPVRIKTAFSSRFIIVLNLQRGSSTIVVVAIQMGPKNGPIIRIVDILVIHDQIELSGDRLPIIQGRNKFGAFETLQQQSSPAGV